MKLKQNRNFRLRLFLLGTDYIQARIKISTYIRHVISIATKGL